MYLPREYSLIMYFLLDKNWARFMEIDPEVFPYSEFEKRRDFLKNIGIRKIKILGRKAFVSVGSKHVTGYDITVALRRVKKEIPAYLDRHREKSKSDTLSGKLENICGEQMSFTFANWLPDDSYRYCGKASAEDMRAYFSRRR